MNYRSGKGFGFRGPSHSWPYIGRGRGGLPRCCDPELWSRTDYTEPVSSRVDEVESTKDLVDSLKQQIENIESRLQGLEKKA